MCNLASTYIFSKSAEDLLELIKQRLAKGQGGIIFSLNPEMFLILKKKPALKKFFNTSLANIPDGIGIAWALRWVYKKNVDRITGVDFLEKLFTVDKGPYYFVGGKPGVAEKAKINAQQKYSLDIVGTQHGYYKYAEEEKIVAEILKKKPRYVLVGLGMPRQEQFVKRNPQLYASAVVLTIGGSLDVIAGNKKRAPRIFQILHLEWLYRFLREPWRLGRILKLPIFVGDILINRKKYQNEK